jgi:predicted DNA binding CopG/RHH family protein
VLEVVAGFDWDEGNLRKCQNHGVAIRELETLLRGEPRVAPDLAHSAHEDRFIAVGRDTEGRPLSWLSRFGPGTAKGWFVLSVLATCTRKKPNAMKRKVPRLRTDEEAEAFLEQDLSDLDFSQFKPVRFEFEKKAARVNMRLPEPLLAAIKARAKARGIPYQRFIREALEQALARK